MKNFASLHMLILRAFLKFNTFLILIFDKNVKLNFCVVKSMVFFAKILSAFSFLSSFLDYFF